MYCAVNKVFATKFVLSAANQVFAAELCCPQRISIRCQKCVGYNELAFAVKVVLSTANQRSLPMLCCLQRKCDSLPKSSCLKQN